MSRSSWGQSATEQKLTQIEKDFWEGWKTHNNESFKKYLASEAIDLSADGVATADELVKAIGSTDCSVNAYAIDGPKFLWVDKNTAVIRYHATQDATCSGHKLPDAVWASTVWANKDGSWKAIFHQESPVAPAMASPQKND
jgi:hypothetical protein